MPPPMRRGRWLRALALSALLLSLALWLFASLRHTSFRYYGVWSVALTRGSLAYEQFTPPLKSPHRVGGRDVAFCNTQFFRDDFDPLWIPKLRRSGPPVPLRSIMLPLWIPISLFALLAWRAHRRVRANQLVGKCPRCAYDRYGLAPSAPCPECGRPAALSAPS